jgi:hypothetical protein
MFIVTVLKQCLRKDELVDGMSLYEKNVLKKIR